MIKFSLSLSFALIQSRNENRNDYLNLVQFGALCLTNYRWSYLSVLSVVCCLQKKRSRTSDSLRGKKAQHHCSMDKIINKMNFNDGNTNENHEDDNNGKTSKVEEKANFQVFSKTVLDIRNSIRSFWNLNIFSHFFHLSQRKSLELRRRKKIPILWISNWFVVNDRNSNWSS